MAFVDGLIGPIASIIDKIIPDPKARDTAKLIAALPADAKASLPPDAKASLPPDAKPSVSASSAGGIGRWLHEPDTAVISAGLLDDLCAQLPGLRRVDVDQPWLTSDVVLTSPFLRSVECLEQLPTDDKGLRRALRERDIGTLTIKGRGTGIDPESLRARLRLTGPASATIVIVLVSGRRIIQLVEPC